MSKYLGEFVLVVGNLNRAGTENRLETSHRNLAVIFLARILRITVIYRD